MTGKATGRPSRTSDVTADDVRRIARHHGSHDALAAALGLCSNRRVTSPSDFDSLVNSRRAMLGKWLKHGVPEKRHADVRAVDPDFITAMKLVARQYRRLIEDESRPAVKAWLVRMVADFAEVAGQDPESMIPD